MFMSTLRRLTRGRANRGGLQDKSLGRGIPRSRYDGRYIRSASRCCLSTRRVPLHFRYSSNKGPKRDRLYGLHLQMFSTIYEP